MNKLVLDIRLVLDTPLHTSGDRHIWGIDKTSAMSVDGHYVIPATSIKGCLRSSAESLLKTWGMEVCQAPQPKKMCQEQTSMCLVCRVFGNPRLAAPLKFSEAKPPSDDDVLPQIRSGVSISRYRRAALSQRLFFIETVSPKPHTEWAAQVLGYFAAEIQAREAAALLYLAAQARQTIGGGNSRGLGWIESFKIQAILDTQTLSEQDYQPFWQMWMEGHEYEHPMV